MGAFRAIPFKHYSIVKMEKAGLDMDSLNKDRSKGPLFRQQKMLFVPATNPGSKKYCVVVRQTLAGAGTNHDWWVRPKIDNNVNSDSVW